MKKQLYGQMHLQDLSKIYRTKCLITCKNNCNIFYTHDVAVEIGFDCAYGCCYSCIKSNECGACCNTARDIKWREMHEEAVR